MDKQTKFLRISGIILAYMLTIIGILGISWVFALSKSWLIGFSLLVVIILIFPALQTILSGERPASLIVFMKIYVAEYASLMMKLIFLLVSVPFIAVSVAGWLAVAMLIAATISWLIVDLSPRPQRRLYPPNPL